MTVLNLQVSSGANDGYGGGLGFFPSNNELQVGYYQAYTIWARFTGCTVPQGATVSSATATITKSGGNSGGGVVDYSISCFAEDNGTAPTNQTDYNSRTLTTAKSTGTNSGSDPFAVSITASVQEVVNRGGFGSSAIVVDWRHTNGGQNGWVNGYAYEGSSGNAPKLDIAYTSGSSALVQPSTKTLSLTTYAPTIRLNKIVQPSVKALSLTTYAPTVKTPRVVSPPVKNLTITRYSPTVLTPRVVRPSVKNLIITCYDFTILTPRIVSPSSIPLTISRYAPTILCPRVISPSTKALSLSSFAPTFLTPRVVQPSSCPLSISLYAPHILTPRVVLPSHLPLTLTGYTPTVQVNDNKIVYPSTANLVIQTYPITIILPVVVRPSTLNLVLQGYAPNVEMGGACSSARYYYQLMAGL